MHSHFGDQALAFAMRTLYGYTRARTEGAHPHWPYLMTAYCMKMTAIGHTREGNTQGCSPAAKPNEAKADARSITKVLPCCDSLDF